MPSVTQMPHLRRAVLSLAALFTVQSAALLPASSLAQPPAEVPATPQQTGVPATPQPTEAPAAPQATKVTIPFGTLVDLKFEGNVVPATSPLGSTVALTVTMPVVIDGKTVIAAGAAATAEITESSKPGSLGKPGSVGVVVKRVAAVDGTIVPLSGTKVVEGKSKQTSAIVIAILCCILGLLQHGENAMIPAGSTISATVATPIDVRVP